MEWVLWVALSATLASLFVSPKQLSIQQRVWFPRVVLLCQVFPFLALIYLFITSDTSYDLVRLYGGQEMPFLYRLSAGWAGREGPTLLWAALLAICGYALTDRDDVSVRESPTSELERRILHGFVLGLLLIAFIMRPFRLSVNTWTGQLNPLLQTDLMVIHPPLVYLFYSLCMVVMVKALAHMFSGEDGAEERIVDAVTPAARAALVVGGVGIGMGGLWAYTVLDWGGYWAWDPVETASLLPWLALLLLLHLRVTPGGSAARWAAALAILPGWFSIHATMVTRANGVWASVHAFVGEGGEGQAETAVGRIMGLQGSGLAGTEVTTYLMTLMVLMALLVSWLVVRQARLEVGERWRRGCLATLSLLLILPLSYFFSLTLLLVEVSLIEMLPSPFLLLLAWAPVLILFADFGEVRQKLFGETWQQLSMLICVLASLFSDDAAVGFLLVVMMLLKVSSDETGQRVWTVAGVVLILTSVYAYLVGVEVAAVLLLAFIWPMLIGDADDSEDGFSRWASKFFERSTQSRLARSAPVVIGSIYLTLTWMLMLASIDATSLAMHEMFGAPLIFLVAAALATYAWRKSVSADHLPWVLLSFLGVGLLFGAVLNLRLVGDGEIMFSDTVSRGAVAWLTLPMLLAALPALTVLVVTLAKRAWKQRSNSSGMYGRQRHHLSDATVAKEGGSRGVAKRGGGWRATLSHAAHLGIVLLLLGHLMTTTLIDRSHPSHQVVLPQGVETEHEGLFLTFTEWEVISPDDAGFSERFKVGDGYLGVKVVVRNSRGEVVDTVNPGMLRFDDSGFPRSETDRYTSLTGDHVFILDWSQTQALGNTSWGMGGESDEVPLDRVRLTVYSLHGSHLVWVGWVMVVLSTAALWFVERKESSGSAGGRTRLD